MKIISPEKIQAFLNFMKLLIKNNLILFLSGILSILLITSYAQAKEENENIMSRIKPIYQKVYDNHKEIVNLFDDVRGLLKSTIGQCEEDVYLFHTMSILMRLEIIYLYIGKDIYDWGMISQKDNVILKCFFESKSIEMTNSLLERQLRDIQECCVSIKKLPLLHILDKTKENIRSSIELLKEYNNILYIIAAENTLSEKARKD